MVDVTAVLPPGRRPGPQPPGEVRRVIPPEAGGTPTWADHVRIHGPLPCARPSDAWRRGGIDEIARSGLLGRGGAAFPVATKLRAVCGAPGRPVVIANGTEGEPVVRKDRVLLTEAPHLVLDGAMVAARIVGATEIVVVAARRGPPFGAGGGGTAHANGSRRDAGASGLRRPELRERRGQRRREPGRPFAAGPQDQATAPGRKGAASAPDVGAQRRDLGPPRARSRATVRSGSASSAPRTSQDRRSSPSSARSSGPGFSRLRSGHPSQRCWVSPAARPPSSRPS